jgi:hypothetical protein
MIKQLFPVTLLSLSFAVGNFSYPVKDAQAETCRPLPLVGGQGSEVSKTVSQPTIPGPFGIKIAHNNWNTDWAVPGDKDFKRFIATISSEEGGSFDVKMYLKYSDQTAGEYFNKTSVAINKNSPLKIEARPRPGDQPYQVNVFVGGLDKMGNSYNASVVGCI